MCLLQQFYFNLIVQEYNKIYINMNRYKVTKQLGDGTYGSVLKAVNRSTHEVVAIKKDEKEVLYMGGMYAIKRSKFFKEIKPSKHRKIKRSHT